MWCGTISYLGGLKEKKISGSSPCALLPMGYFVQGVMCHDSGEAYLK